MVLYVLVEDIKNRLKLFNNTHIFDPYISVIPIWHSLNKWCDNKGLLVVVLEVSVWVVVVTPFVQTFVVTPFVQGVSEPIRRVFNSYGVSVSFKPHQTLRQLLVSPKDKAKVEEQTGAVYRIPCAGCDQVYIGETKRSIGERLKEHNR